MLVIACHADDETLGCAGTIKKHTIRGDEVYVSILGESATAQYTDLRMIDERRKMAEKACSLLGVEEIFFHDFKDMCIDQAGQLNVNRTLEDDISKARPDFVLTHTEYEINTDHRLVHNSSMVATRGINKVASYEIPLSTTNQFRPNFFVDITDTYQYKVKACKLYYSEYEKWLPRIKKTAEYRGMQAGVDKAEAFFVERWIE